MTWTIRLVDQPDPEVAVAIGTPLARFNDRLVGQPDQRRFLAVTLAAPDSDAVAGGLWGWTIRGYLHVDLLFVPENARGGGIGRALMQEAEREAVRRGCHAAWLSTYSFQAPGFYQKLGYRVFGELPDYPPGHRSIFLTKRLAGEGA